MKRLLSTSAVLLTFATALSTSGADLTLIDGRTFHDATILSQTPRKVVIKHTDGLSGIEKSLLPSELAARYPVDEAAAREAERQANEARLRAEDYHQAEAQRAALIRLEREQTALHNAQLAALEAAERRAEAAEAELAQRPTVVVYRDTGYFSPFYRRTVTTGPVCDEPRWNEKPRDNRFVRDGRDHRDEWTRDASYRSPRQKLNNPPADHRPHNQPGVPRISQAPRTDDNMPATPTGSVIRR